MALTGIDAVVFGVADMTEAKRFLDDWGVSRVSAAADKLVYRTRDGAEVIVGPARCARSARRRSKPAIRCAK